MPGRPLICVNWYNLWISFLWISFLRGLRVLRIRCARPIR
jgi:hypothetical protein